MIVIVVIGILAAITIVAFNGIQNRANDTAVRSDLANIAKKLELARSLDDDNVYPTGLTANGLDIKVSKGAYGNHYFNGTANYNMVYCRDNTVPEFAVIARSKSGKTFAVNNDTGIRETSQVLTTAPTSCPAEGVNNSGASWSYQSNVGVDGWPNTF